jgi:hypothetical protein
MIDVSRLCVVNAMGVELGTLVIADDGNGSEVGVRVVFDGKNGGPVPAIRFPARSSEGAGPLVRELYSNDRCIALGTAQARWSGDVGSLHFDDNKHKPKPGALVFVGESTPGIWTPFKSDPFIYLLSGTRVIADSVRAVISEWTIGIGLGGDFIPVSIIGAPSR